VSEIDGVCGPKNERESKRDQGINAAGAVRDVEWWSGGVMKSWQAGKEKLKGYAHSMAAG
jgi:hypothetical protein